MDNSPKVNASVSRETLNIVPIKFICKVESVISVRWNLYLTNRNKILKATSKINCNKMIKRLILIF